MLNVSLFFTSNTVQKNDLPFTLCNASDCAHPKFSFHLSASRFFSVFVDVISKANEKPFQKGLVAQWLKSQGDSYTPSQGCRRLSLECIIHCI